jgi:Flp pilus assembly protein CpaB
MEMEFKDNSRRRTLVLVIGVLLALGAGAAAFMLSSQGTEEAAPTIPLNNVVVATGPIEARSTIQQDQLLMKQIPLDASNELAFTQVADVAGRIAAIPIYQNQVVLPNMLASANGIGAVEILEPDATVAPESPYLRAVSLTVPTERAVGGLIGVDQRVDVIATMPWAALSDLVDPETGEPLTDPATGEPALFTSGTATKPMWLDVAVIGRPEGSPDLYILRMDLQQAEEVALAQSVGAQFSLVLRPATDTRDVDRSQYGETQDRLMERYNFPIPEMVDALTYPQPQSVPSPFPNEPYLQLDVQPSPVPSGDLIEIPVDETVVDESPAPSASPAP